MDGRCKVERTLTTNPGLLMATLAVTAATVAVACGKDFASCKSTKSCSPEATGGAGSNGGGGGNSSSGSATGGSSASGGSSSNTTGAGAGGEPPTTECDSDSDCDDGRFCNGTEHCDEGVCRTGSAPECTADDPTHCSTVCDEEADACVTTARDLDRDGHGTIACDAAPGDDCDDEDDGVNPDAPEICDGVDNDCNDAADIADGLQLAGDNQVILGYETIDLAWAPPGKRYGVALGHRGVHFAKLDTDGEFSDPELAIEGTETTGTYFPSIAWGSDRFGLVSQHWKCDVGDDCFGTIRTAEFSTFPSSPLTFDDTRTFVHQLSWVDDNWLVVAVGNDPGLLKLTTGFSLSPAEELDRSEAVHHPDLAIAEDQLVVTWEEATSIYWARAGLNRVFGTPQLVAAEGRAPAIAVVAQGIAIAWLTSDTIWFEIRNTEGELVCGPSSAPFGSTGGGTPELALASTDRATLALAVDHSGTELGLLAFDSQCQLAGQTTVSDDASGLHSPRLAAGGGTVAMGWSEEAGTVPTPTAHLRMVGELLCE